MRATLAFNGLNEEKPLFIYKQLASLNEVGLYSQEKSEAKRRFLVESGEIKEKQN